MVGKTLVESDIEAGAQLLRALDNRQVAVTAAFWLFDPEFERWSLFLAMPLCDQKGPIAAYRTIRETLAGIPEPQRLSSMDVTAANTRDVIVQALSRIIHTGNTISRFRVSKSSANGVFVDDAIIYRTT